MYHRSILPDGKPDPVLDIALDQHHPVRFTEPFRGTLPGIVVHLHLPDTESGFVEITLHRGTLQDSRGHTALQFQDIDDLPDRESKRSPKLPENFDELLEQAIQLKREVPKRSVRQIIYILELEGRVAPGVLKRSTMERYLYKAGFGVRQMQMYNDARKSSSKRFCKPHRMMLIQGDIKYGIKLPIGRNGAMVQTYLSSAIDDHSRYVIQSEFYASQEESIVEDTFRKAVLKAGKFDACYFDNGSQ